MFTEKRLDEAYRNARVEYFDENSKYVFISDVHRGNGSLADEFSRNRNIYLHALKHYYRNNYIYVEVGDGDEMLEYADFRHTKNAHPDVYGVIKDLYDEGRYIRLYGNHDIYLKNPAYVKKHYYTNYDEYNEIFYDFLKGLQPIESLLLKHKRTQQEIFVVHGHQGDGPNDQFWFFTMLSLKFFWRYLHGFGIRNPTSPVKNVTRRHKIEKSYSKWIIKNKKMLLCGHTHRFKFPQPDELPYFNTGCCVYPTIITAIELKNGEIQLVRWTINAARHGELKVEREIMRGPMPVEEFDLRYNTARTANTTDKFDWM